LRPPRQATCRRRTIRRQPDRARSRRLREYLRAGALVPGHRGY
jgi:hypothetical protein